MRWRSPVDGYREYRYWKHVDSFEWRDWFAWYPVKTSSGQWVWLEKIKRKNHHRRERNGVGWKDVYWYVYK